MISKKFLNKIFSQSPEACVRREGTIIDECCCEEEPEIRGSSVFESVPPLRYSGGPNDSILSSSHGNIPKQPQSNNQY